ncbi:putative transposase [Salmonella phage 40]|nr:putative transposase [Salmonella phage 40]
MVSTGSDGAIAKHFRCVWKLNVLGGMVKKVYGVGVYDG